MLKLTSIPDAVAAAGAALSRSDPAVQQRQIVGDHHPAKRKREADDADRPSVGASVTDSATDPTAVPSVSAPYSGVDTAELASVVPWARRRFAWEALQLQLQVCLDTVTHTASSVTSYRTAYCAGHRS